MYSIRIFLFHILLIWGCVCTQRTPCLRACLVKKFTFSRMQQTTACLHFACRTTPCVSGRAARRSCLPGLRRGGGGGRQAGAAVLSCLAWRRELALRCGAQVTQPFFDLPTHVKRTAAGQGWGGGYYYGSYESVPVRAS